MQASAVIQLAERLMTRPLNARRQEMVVQYRSVQVMQTVAMMMSDIGRSEVFPLSGMSTNVEPDSKQSGDHEQQEREGQHHQVSEPTEGRHEVVAALGGSEVVVGRAVPGHEAAPVEAEDLHRAEAPAMALRVQSGEAGRHDASAEAAGDVHPRPARLEHPQRRFGVFADAPLVPAADVLERAAAEEPHGADERHGVAFVA